MYGDLARHVTVHCGQAGASAWATGAILDTIDLLRFRDDHPNRGKAVAEMAGPKPAKSFATT